MRLITRYVLLLILVITASDVTARSFRLDQIPNGAKYSCSTCHTGYGGPRNDFGKAIETGYLDVAGSAGNVLWGPALAALDSDKDSVSNGGELQDSAGVWKIGDPAPGTLSLVSNPGNPASTTDVDFAEAAPMFFVLNQNYPNPFNPSTTITFVLPNNAAVRLNIYNPLGQPVRELLNESLTAGEYHVVWNGADANGSPVVSGIYFARLESEGVIQTIRMLLMK